MAPPSQLSIATSSVNRLLKEEASYRTELEGQHRRLEALQSETGDDEEGNRAWNIGQQVQPLGHDPWEILIMDVILTATSREGDRSGIWTFEGENQQCCGGFGVTTGTDVTLINDWDVMQK